MSSRGSKPSEPRITARYRRIVGRRCASGLLASLSLGCARPGVTAPSPALSAPTYSETRVSDIFLEPKPSLPSPATDVEARGVVALREPVGRAAIIELIQAFVDAWRRESVDDLASFLSQSADTGPIEARGRGREAIVESWKERLKAHVHEYAKLQGDLVATDRVQFWDSDDLGDVYVSAPMRVASSAGRARLAAISLVK